MAVGATLARAPCLDKAHDLPVVARAAFLDLVAVTFLLLIRGHAAGKPLGLKGGHIHGGLQVLARDLCESFLVAAVRRLLESWGELREARSRFELDAQ